MNLEAALLGLINMHPDVSGYQLKSIVDNSSGRIAQIHLSKIYPELKKMTEKGLLSCRAVPQKSRLDQKFYTLTEKGLQTLNKFLMEPFAFGPNRSCFDEYLLQLAGMAYLDNERIRSFIDEGISYLEKEIEFRQGENIAIDEDFITNTDKFLQKRYSELWSNARTFMLNEAVNRRAWLIKLKQKYL